MHKKKEKFSEFVVQKNFFCVRMQLWNSSPPSRACKQLYVFGLTPHFLVCAYVLSGWLHGGSVFNCKYSVFHIYLTFTFFSEFLCNFFPRQSQIKSIRTWQKFQPLSPGSQCWNQANFGKKAFQNQYWVQGWEKKFVQFLLHLFCPEF